MPHEEIIIPMPSNMAHAIAFFFFMLFFILVVNILVFSSFSPKHGTKIQNKLKKLTKSSIFLLLI